MQYLYQNMQYVHVIIQASHSQRIVCYSLKLTLSLSPAHLHSRTQAQARRQAEAEAERHRAWTFWTFQALALNLLRRRSREATAYDCGYPHTHTHTHESRVGSYKGNSNNNESTYSAVRSLWRKPGPVSGSGSGPNSGAWPVAVIGFANTPTCTHTHTCILPYMCILNLYCAFAFEFAWPHTTLHMCLTQNLENASFLERR